MTQGKPASIGGVYEVGIGVRDPIPQIQYWEQFGYQIDQIGELPAKTAQQLYGVNSSLRSIRLKHQDSDHGFVRLMVWEKPTNEGLEMESMKVKGNRWAVTMTADVLNIMNHVEEAIAAGWTLKYTAPEWTVIYQMEGTGRPFVTPPVGVREMMLIQPLARQVLFERFNYTLPYYGNINVGSALKTSQFTHVGMVIQDDSKELLKFYDEVLGLLRVRDDIVDEYATAKASREILDLKPDERYFTTDFDDPRSSEQDLQAMRSGRLKIIRFPAAIELPDLFERAKPGCLGMSLYTYRVRGLEVFFNRVQASQAQQVTEIVSNEFGEQSFSFVAPDGYFWTFLE